MQDRIVRMVSGPEDDPVRWQYELEQIISDHTDYHGWIDYDQAYDCMVEVAEYLEECLPSLLIGGQLVDAAKLTMTVYGAAFGQDMDDSDDGAYHPLLRLYEEGNLPEAIELVRKKRQWENIPWSNVHYAKTLLTLLEKAGERAQYE